MSTQEFLTDWIIKYVEKNYSNLKITYDGAYGFDDNRWVDRPKRLGICEGGLQILSI